MRSGYYLPGVHLNNVNFQNTAYDQRFWRVCLADLKSVNLPPFVLTVFFASRVNPESLYDFPAAREPKELFGEVP